MILRPGNLKYSKGFTPLDSKHLTGFTLIELAVIIIILSIISTVAIVRFINLHKRTERLREDSVISALRTSILFNYSKTNTWPENSPFTLVDNPPPYVDGCSGLDDKNWGVFESDGYWRMFSPQSTYCLGEPSGPGKEWQYYYQGPKAGQLIKVYDGEGY